MQESAAVSGGRRRGRAGGGRTAHGRRGRLPARRL